MAEPVLEDRRPGPARLVGFVLLLALVSWGLGAFAAWPWVASDPSTASIRVAFKHVAAFAGPGRVPAREEIEKRPRHMQPLSAERARTGRRVDTILTVDLDRRRLLHRRYPPGGLRRDGPSFAFEELAVPPGRHVLDVSLADAAGADPEAAARRWQAREEVEIRPGQSLLVEFSEEGKFVIR
jgi:hypothetical protein